MRKTLFTLLALCICMSAQTTKPKTQTVATSKARQTRQRSRTKAIVKAGVSGPSVSLTCTAPTTGPTVQSFNFYRLTISGTSCPAPSSSYTLLGGSASCSYNDTTVSPGTNQCYTATSLTIPVGGTCSAPPCESSMETPAVLAQIPALPTVTSVSPTSGTTGGGTSITITGTGFLSGATVAVGSGNATSVVVVSSTEITAVTPSGTAGTVSIAVTNSVGGTGTLSSAFTYVTPQAPNPPTGLTVGTITAQNVPLNWNPYANQPGVTFESFNLYDCQQQTCPSPPLVTTTTSTSYTAKCTRTNKVCYFALKANVLYNGKKVLTGYSNIVKAVI